MNLVIGHTLATGLGLALVCASQPAAQEAYRTHDDLVELSGAWTQSGAARVLSLGDSYGGRRLLAVEIGAPGEVPVVDRPVVLLVGAPDGRSAAGAQAVLHVVDQLTRSADQLPEHVTFLAVPFANPDGLVASAKGLGFGANDRPVDDDGDGRLDEDGPEDLSGEGLVLEMLLEDPEGHWVKSTDGRSLRRAESGEGPRFLRLPEGSDADQDGRYNEDGPGGVVIDRNFPVGWTGSWSVRGAGELPLSEPASRALARLVAERRVAVALVFQGCHGTLARPGAIGRLPDVPEDVSLWREFARSFQAATGRKSLDEGRLERLDAVDHDRTGGAFVDWLYFAERVPTVEVAPWGLCVAEGIPSEVRVRDGSLITSLEPLDPLAAEEARWCEWLDATRGGIGFLEWEPIQLDDGRIGYVGGWEPLTRHDPPESELSKALAGTPEFVVELARSLPRYELDVRTVRHEGDVALIEVSVRNLGRLPSHAGPRLGAEPLTLTIDAGRGAEFLAGSRHTEVGELAGAALSKPFRWLLRASEGTQVTLELTGPGIRPLVEEFRP